MDSKLCIAVLECPVATAEGNSGTVEGEPWRLSREMGPRGSSVRVRKLTWEDSPVPTETHISDRTGERVCACVCVCVCERERERESVCYQEIASILFK